jgi:hypothetical protein
LQEIKEELSKTAKASFINAQDLCDIVAGKRLQSKFAQMGIEKSGISLLMAQQWLEKLKRCYGKVKNRMYIDGHERDNVMAYRKDFVERWVGYETRFQIWDNDGNTLPRPPDSFPLILVMHNESTFFQNDERKTCWSHQDSRPSPKPKGDGQSLMVSSVSRLG